MSEPQGWIKIGVRAVVLSDDPYHSGLKAGDVVTVSTLTRATVTTASGILVPAVYVQTADGARIVGIDALAPAPEEEPYTPGEPDEVVDGILEKMVRGDRELFTFFLDAETALGAVEPQVSAQLTAEPSATPGHDRGYAGESSTPTTDHYGFRDFAGDELDVYYGENQCDTHGRESAFFFTFDEERVVVIPANQIDPLIRFLFNRRNYSKRDED